MNTTFINKILKSLINHNKESADINQMINESTEKINKIKLTEEEKKYITKKYSDYVNIIKHSINENSDDDFQQKVSHKRKFINNVLRNVVNESKLIWKPTQLTFNRDNGWNDVRVAVPFNDYSTTPAQYFKNEGRHQKLFKVGFENFVQDIYGLSEGETYYVYHMYLKEMFTKISYFIRENMETSEELNEENIFKKYARKGFNKLVGQKNVNEKFIEKMAQFIERRWDEVINVTWTYDVWGEIILTVYIDEHDNQPLTSHPLEREIWSTLRDEWKLSDGKTFLTFKVKVINLNKDTDYSGIKSDINEVKKRSSTQKIKYNEGFLNKVIKYIKRRYPQVVDVKIDKTSWFKGWKEFLHIYVDEDDGQPTDLVQHPLEWDIYMDLTSGILQGLNNIDIKVTNLNKDTKLRGYTGEGINESYNRYDETISNKDFVDKVVKRMVDKTEVNLYMSDYDPWTTHSPWFGNFITPDFGNYHRAKYNIAWLLSETKNLDSIIDNFGRELIEVYGFSTNGELKYFESEYIKKMTDKVKLLQIPFIEKRRKQKEEYHKKYNINESKKDVKKEWDEIQRAVQDLSRHHNFNTSVTELADGIVDSSPQPLSSEIWDVLENTESNEIEEGDFDTVFRLAQKYGKSNPLKLIKKLKEGSYNPPIIVRYEDKYWLVAGNTRLCTASALGITPEVLIIDLNKPFPVESVQKNKNLL